MFSGRSMVKWNRVAGWRITVAFFGAITHHRENWISHHASFKWGANHAPYSRKDSYAQSRLTWLICTRSRISLIVCDPSRHGIPLCHPDEKTLHSHLGRASILVPNPLTFIPSPIPIRRLQRRLKSSGNNFHSNSYFTERCRWLPLSFPWFLLTKTRRKLFQFFWYKCPGAHQGMNMTTVKVWLTVHWVTADESSKAKTNNKRSK